MTTTTDFNNNLEAKVAEQLNSQRVGYLLGAGSSYLENAGYPLTFELWDLIKDRISDGQLRAKIQSKLDDGATGIEQALDLLDDGGAVDAPERHVVTEAIADLFGSKRPTLDVHTEFVRRIFGRNDATLKIFSLNYDPLIERAAESAKVRISDGFLGVEHAFFDAAVFEERVGRFRHHFRSRLFEATVMPIQLFKLHGSLGWYECPQIGVRRCAYDLPLPDNTKRLMVPPQRRKATDTMFQPYAALWSAFRGCLSQDSIQLNRLACFGYGFADEHVNAVIDAALARPDFTLLIFAKALSEDAWERWSAKDNTIVVTESRCSIKGAVGPGHVDLWSFERISKEV